MAGKLMHAVQYERYGGGVAGLKHVQIPIPSPKRDEVLIKLEAVSLNPADWKIQKGLLRPFMPRKFPFIPATDVAGEVVGAGPGVHKFKAGDKVVAFFNPFTGGGLAEYAVVSENRTVARPEEVQPHQAAGLPIAGLTALMAITQSAGLKLDGPDPNDPVQLAKLANAHVPATCGSRNIDLVRSLGADEVLDYTTAEGATLASPSGRKYDVVIHCANGIAFSRLEPRLSENGRVICVNADARTMWDYAVKTITLSKKKLVPLVMIPKAENLETMVNLMKEGKIKTVIDSRHELSKAEEGWAKCMDGHATGKIIVEP
ncbi:PREDICTED: putative quinone-oxidoreductase homolog, chloroplastic [Tarenaya hassleriana]|uniref:putative quinone-oxidoreductase homolog, chloroplastic n=1 Tax=Tarenaya hassleriana TaxID=28532 RepID=UPI00053C3647|nr:PREDICTED: putative quinone-oxidoreductase homolog, chloroplastic [Tarenaya hassleriana]